METDADRDWIAVGYDMIQSQVTRMREGCMEAVEWMLAMDPMPSGGLVQAIKLYRTARGCSLGEARRAVLNRRAELRRAQFTIAARPMTDAPQS